MTTPDNGYVPPDFLATLSGSTVTAEKNTAAAFGRLRAAHPDAHITGPAGGYWPRSLDEAIHNNPSAFGISASEAKKLSPIGVSPHGMGVRLNFAGVSPAVAAQFDFSEFNSYTFTYTGMPSWEQAQPSVSTLDVAQVKQVAAYLNGRAASVGLPTTTAVGNGIQGPRYWTLVQKLGSVDGLYPQPAYLINGVPGPRTLICELHYLSASNPPASAPAPAPAPVPTPPAVTPPESTTLPTPDPKPTPPEPAPPTTNTPETPTVTIPDSAKPLTPAQIAAAEATLEADSAALSGATPALSGLLAAHPKARKRAYIIYASAALIISFGPDVVTAGLLNTHSAPVVVAVVTVSSGILLKIGVALGFVAASNAK